MKQLLLIFALSIVLTSCKKQNNTPSQQSTQNNTTTPTSTVTANDSTNTNGSPKTKIYFSVRMPNVITSVRQYKHDTLNLKIYHNVTPVKNCKFYYNGVSGSITAFNNYSAQTGTSNDLTHPVWMNSGDSLIIESDSLEFIDAPYNQAFVNNKLSIKKLVGSVLTEIDSRLIWDANLPVGFIAPYLGTGYESGTGTNHYWYLGRKVRIVYILP
jgi:N-acetylmuramoyl-L-alanine amidase CwlA